VNVAKNVSSWAMTLEWGRDDLWIVSNYFGIYITYSLGLGIIECRSGCEKIAAHVKIPSDYI